MEDEDEIADRGSEAGPGSPPADDGQRCGFVAIIGAPNAGKSTLVNQLVGAKVTIVSRKVQTTRMVVRGIAISGQSQIVFIDTPGIFVPRRRLDRAMVNAAWGGAADADVVIVLVDAMRGIDDDLVRIVDRLGEISARKILVVNKIDKLTEKERLLPIVEQVSAVATFDEVFLLSALTGDGVQVLLESLASRMPEGPWHFPGKIFPTCQCGCWLPRLPAKRSTTDCIRSYPTP